MKLGNKGQGDDLELDMSPMIDMVFLLLIFFIVASQIIDDKPQVEIPPAAYGKVPEDTTGRLMISVSKDGMYYIGSNVETSSIEQVQDTIGEWMDQDPETRILIRSDAYAKYKYNEKVTIACAEVGAQDVIYSVFEE